jgi:pyrroloquinoline quinone (PQQ) biosynthesis protein C
MKKLKKEKEESWIKAVLSNDEYSSNEELVKYFMDEGKLTEKQAKKWVAKRNFYLNNIVLNDGSVFKPKL